MNTARELKVDRQIRHLGYVPANDMAALYANAEALVMPTFFGPTNIPILEAWGLGCPVITSDIRALREQAGDAALLADPNSADTGRCDQTHLARPGTSRAVDRTGALPVGTEHTWRLRRAPEHDLGRGEAAGWLRSADR